MERFLSAILYLRINRHAMPPQRAAEIEEDTEPVLESSASQEEGAG